MDTTIAYIAGLFDGEGYIRLRLRERHKTQVSRGKVYPHNHKWYVVSTNTANKNKECLLLCQELYGGRIYERPPVTENRAKLYHWYLEGHKVLVFLKAIQPYAIIKKPHIEAILNNRENKEYASRLLRMFNKRGPIETSNIPLI